MFDIFKKSLRNKLLLTLMFIGFLPFVTLLIYTLYLSETKIVNKIINEQFEKTDSITKQINNQLNSLKKEVAFIASLDVMDDILADDIDKRISRLLTQKSNDLNLKNTFMVINNSSIIIASSNAEEISKTLDINNITKDSSGTYIKDKMLYIYSKIEASFDTTKKIGFLVLKYNLDNLDIFLTHKKETHSYIINPKLGIDIGNQISFDLPYNKNKDSLITSKHLIVYKQMNSIFKNWYIVYAVDKNVALVFLYDFITFMFYISIPIFIIIILISIKYAKGIVKPIEELTFTTDKITNTRNYSAQLSIKSKDEIGTLTNSFNDMLRTTSSALYKLEEENKLRLKRFTQLIEVLNTIIQTKDEKECIDTSISQMQTLTDKKNLSFNTDKIEHVDKSHISLFVTDFEKNEQMHFGSIDLGIDKIDDINERKFYDSIGTMITLQLDRIRLIERTMSASRAKSAFISNMSHELRTPLNAIIGFSQFLIAYEELTDDQQDTVANIETSAHYLLDMINEILDIAKIEAGKMEAHFEETDILELVKSSHTMLLPLANDKKLDFTLTTDNFIDKKYKTDPKMFKQIVINLVSNAIKFTTEGFVSLELYTHQNKIYIKVQDSGIGISADDIKRLFNDFTQVENVMQKKHKGTGLGLSLSKKMANLLNGDVTIESQGLKYGTTALFSIKV